MPLKNPLAAPTRLEIARPTRILPPAPKPPLVDALPVSVSVDLANRTIDVSFRVASEDGSRIGHRRVTIRDGRTEVVEGIEVVSSTETPEGFEDLAAAVKAFVSAVVPAALA